MKSIKVFYMGKPLHQVYPHATYFQVLKWRTQELFKFILRFLFKVTLISSLAYSLFFAGSYFGNPTITYAVKEIPTLSKDVPPVLQRIGGCESDGNKASKGSMFGANGQVRTHANTNGTTDVGQYMINNDVWGKKASDLGFNIFTQEGNESMAKWIFTNIGTDPWSASRPCWSH